MRLSPLILLLALLAPVPAFAQTAANDSDKNWPQVCKQSQAQPLPPAPSHGPIPQDKLSGCDESSLYFGFDQKPDYTAALECGWYQRAHPESASSMFYGPGVLTMLYANGQGVERNYDLAIRFACEDKLTATAEMEMRIGHLERLRDTHAITTSFNLCDDVTSGAAMGLCTSVDTRRADVERTRKIAAIVARLPAAAQAAFPRLQSAESAFEQARSSKEIDLSGTARGMFQLEEQKMLRDQFLINLQRFAGARIPPASAADLATLDRQLNTACNHVENQIERKMGQAGAQAGPMGTISPEGIRDTQRSWLALSQAWLDFARDAYPSLSATSLRAQLIRLRLHQLRSLATSSN